MFGIAIVAIVPLRLSHSDASEMVSQLLFGEHFEITERFNQWMKVKAHFDQYEGWIDSKQCQIISELDYQFLCHEKQELSADLLNYITISKKTLMPIVLGSSLNFLNQKEINIFEFSFEGNKIAEQKTRNELLETAFLYLNAPYLWGGKTPFGIDCSGFTQMVYKLNGYHLLRDASQQATQGEALSFIEESEAGDLAFFDNEDGKIIHVGIMMENNYIIHASGKVRIDRLDHLGIYNAELNKHTHRLRVIKKIM